MRPDIAVVLGNGIKDFADAMTDVVPYDEFQEKQGQDNPYNREGKIEIIEAMITETIGQKVVGVVEGVFQRYRCQSAPNPHQNTEDQHELMLPEVSQTPYIQTADQ